MPLLLLQLETGSSLQGGLQLCICCVTMPLEEAQACVLPAKLDMQDDEVLLHGHLAFLTCCCQCQITMLDTLAGSNSGPALSR